MDLIVGQPQSLQDHRDAQPLAMSFTLVTASRPAGEPLHGPPPRHVLRSSGLYGRAVGQHARFINMALTVYQGETSRGLVVDDR